MPSPIYLHPYPVDDHVRACYADHDDARLACASPSPLIIALKAMVACALYVASYLMKGTA